MSLKQIEEDRLWSHSGNAAGQWHGLVEHLTSVASRAAEFAEAFGAAPLAWWLGLLHDLGKGAETWQQRLVALGADGGRVGIDHKAAGTRFAVERAGLWRLAMVIHGHHGGLENPAQLHAFLTSPERDRLAEDQAVRRLSGHIAELQQPTPPPWPRWARDDPEAGEMLLRMLFSALVDADHLDTAAHFRGVERGPTKAPVGMAELLDRFERGRARLLAEREPASIDELRVQVYADSVRAAACSPGFFRLEAPTGAGKTLAAGGFALHHAKRHGMCRVVFAVPFLSVTDQNAKVYRDLLDPDLDAEQCLVRLSEKGETVRWQPVSPTLMRHLLVHAAERGAAPGEPLLRYRNGRPITARRYDHLWTRLGRHLPWVARQGVSTHWLRHTTLTWVERNFGYGVARAYAGHTGKSDVGTTTTYVRAYLEEVAAALAALTGEPHPLAEIRERGVSRGWPGDLVA